MKSKLENITKGIQDIKDIATLGYSFVGILDDFDIPEWPRLYLQCVAMKTAGLLHSISLLGSYDHISEAQILMRVLVELKINTDYLYKKFQKEGVSAFQIVSDAQFIGKNKAVQTYKWSSKDKKIIDDWQNTISRIQAKYSKEELKKIKRNSLYEIPLEQRARLTRNMIWYNLVYRLYSKSVHGLDINELWAEKNKVQNVLVDRVEVLVMYAPKCASSIMLKCKKLSELLKTK